MSNKKIYIEAGANDGIFQSRSLHLEKDKDFLGVLIEPIPQMYDLCKVNRPNSLCYNCALVNFDYVNAHIEINIHNKFTAMATIVKSPLESYLGSIEVPARTLDSILEENKFFNIEYLFLDVEGYEFDVLKGINLENKIINIIEIECHYSLLNMDKNFEINRHSEYLQKFKYKLVETITHDGNLKLIYNK